MKIKNINKILPLLIITISLQSCGLFNSVFKKTDKNKEKTEVNISKNINTEFLDKSLITIKEKADTILKIDGSKFNNSIFLYDLKNINNISVLNNDLVEVKQTYDTLEKKLKTNVLIKPKNINIKFDKTTIINKDIYSNTTTKQDSNIKVNKLIKSDIKTKEPKNTFWFVILSSIIAIGLFLGIKKILEKKLL